MHEACNMRAARSSEIRTAIRHAGRCALAAARAYKMLCIIEDDTGLNPDANTLSRGKHFPP